ncbi:hypothetical protein C8R46DRAFT_43806 [Mycena filopes]|nr:hypothetical protein C8R46DRAFT_43806 [Mycena filopes]
MLTFSRVWLAPRGLGNPCGVRRSILKLARFTAPAAVLMCLEHTPIHTALPNLRVLQEINAFHPKAHVFSMRGNQWPLHGLRNLESLTVTISLACACGLWLLTANPMSRLRVLYLEAHIQAPEYENPTQLIQVLANRCPALEELTMKWILIGYTPRPMQNVEIDAAVFEPLAACASLTKLDLSAPFALTFDELGAGRLATALSRLRICRLCFIPIDGPSAERHRILPALAGLVPFAEHCPRLEELHLIVDPKVPAVGAVPALRFPALRKLSIGHFVEPEGWNASAVARYLAALLPSCCSVAVPPRPVWNRLWKNAGEIEEGETDAFELISTV